MHYINCSSIARSYNYFLAEGIKDQDIMVPVDLTRSDSAENLFTKCFPILSQSFFSSFQNQTVKYIEHEKFNDYAITPISTSLVNLKYNLLNPSLYELTASKIASYLFPLNFAEYRFVIQQEFDENENIDAAYYSSASINSDCSEGVEGVESVYAAAFFLGLEIRSIQCINQENAFKPYIFVDDFSHPFHRINRATNELSEEYRDHKISNEKGVLFPATFMPVNCETWIGQSCDPEKLKIAYSQISNTPIQNIFQIIDLAIKALQAIECVGDAVTECKESPYYSYMDEVKIILGNNWHAIRDLVKDYN